MRRRPQGREAAGKRAPTVGRVTLVETKGFSELPTPSLVDSGVGGELDHSFNVFTPRDHAHTPENGRSNSVGSSMAISSMKNHKQRVSRDLSAELRMLDGSRTSRETSRPLEQEENYLKAIVEKIRQEVMVRTKQLEKEDSFYLRSR